MFLASKHHSYMLCKNTKFQLIVGSYRLLDKGQPGGHAPPPPDTFFGPSKTTCQKRYGSVR